MGPFGHPSGNYFKTTITINLNLFIMFIDNNIMFVIYKQFSTITINIILYVYYNWSVENLHLAEFGENKHNIVIYKHNKQKLVGLIEFWKK